jgi:glutaconate CoA-transferase subunit A
MVHLKKSFFAEDKTMSLNEAIKKFVKSNCLITFGGSNGRHPMAAVYEIARQKIGELKIIAENCLTGEDLLTGLGLVEKIETSWVGISGLDMAFNIRRAIEQGIPRPIEFEDYSNFTGSLRFLAGAMGVSFMPTKSLLGSSIPKYNPRIKIIEDPYTDELVALVPSANPDVAILPVQRADKRGNAQIFGHIGIDDLKARAAENVIILCEEIVDTDEIRKIPNSTLIPEYLVKAVVKVPYCCHPWDMYGYYYYDLPFYRDYGACVRRSYDEFLKWVNEYIYDCEDHFEYCEKVGWKRLFKLSEMAKKISRIPV